MQFLVSYRDRQTDRQSATHCPRQNIETEKKVATDILYYFHLNNIIDSLQVHVTGNYNKHKHHTPSSYLKPGKPKADAELG